MTSIMKSLTLTALFVTAGAALAQQPHLAIPKGISPSGYAQIYSQYAGPDGKVHLVTGPMHPYNAEFKPAAVCVNPAFDMYEYDPAQVATALIPIDNPAYGCDVGIAGSRYTFGATYVTGKNYNDMGCIAGTAGKLCRRAGWLFNVVTPAVHQQATIITTCENYTEVMADANVAGPTGRGDITGSSWLLTFTGSLAAGFYRSEIELASGSGWTMPADGAGAYIIQNGDYDSATSTITIGTCSTGAWGIKTGNPSGQQGTGPTNNTEWSDQVTIDNMFGTSELRQRYSTTYPPCLNNKLGSTICFLYENVLLPVTLVPTNLNILLGSNNNGGTFADLANDDATFVKICKAFVPSLSSPKIRFECDYTSPYLTPSLITVDMKARMSTGGVFVTRAYVADRVINGAGTYAYNVADKAIVDTAINTTYANYTGTLTGAQYVHTDNTMRTRVEVSQTGFSAAAIPCAEFEKLNVTVNP